MSKMTQYRNAPLHHAIRYPLFERVDGELHEQRVFSIGAIGEWLDPQTRQVFTQPTESRVQPRQVALTPIIADQQMVAVSRPRYIARDPILPAGAYHVESVRHQFTYDGTLLPATVDAEAVLYRGGNCYHPGGEPVAAVKFDPRQALYPDASQRAVVIDPQNRQWVGPVQSEQVALMKGYIDLLGQLAFDPDRGL